MFSGKFHSDILVPRQVTSGAYDITEFVRVLFSFSLRSAVLLAVLEHSATTIALHKELSRPVHATQSHSTAQCKHKCQWYCTWITVSKLATTFLKQIWGRILPYQV